MAEIAYPQHFKTAVVGPARVKYAYVHMAPETSSKPYFLFLHGFPCTSYDWHHQIDQLSSAGYGIIAPDLLGYGSTDRPDDFKEYRMKKMAGEVVGILDAEGAQKVIGVGHDWGAAILSKVANYHQDRLMAYAFLSASYVSPKAPFDIDAINAMSKAQMGVPILEYFHFFNTDHEPEELLMKDLDSTMSLLFCDLPGHFPTHVSPVSGIKPYLTNSEKRPMPDWLTPAHIATYKSIFSASGFHGALNWYRQHMRGTSSGDDEEIAEEKCHVHKPVLVVPCTTEEIMAPGMVEQMAKPWCEDLRVRELECRHWCMLAKPDECSEYLREFAEEVAGKA